MSPAFTTANAHAQQTHSHQKPPFTPTNPSKPSTFPYFRIDPRAPFQNSPHSDYYTDDAASPSPSQSHSRNTIDSPEKSALLARLDRLLAQAETEAEFESAGGEGRMGSAWDLVESKVREMEVGLGARHSQTRLPFEMEDSGLFIADESGEENEDEDEDEEIRDEDSEDAGLADQALKLIGSGTGSPTPQQRKTSNGKSTTLSANDFDRESLTKTSRELLRTLIHAQRQLRDRHSELQTLNTAHLAHLSLLQTENGELYSRLTDTTEEFLEFKRAVAGVEEEVLAVEAAAEEMEGWAPGLASEVGRVRRERVGRCFLRLRGRANGVRSERGVSSTGGILQTDGMGEVNVDAGADVDVGASEVPAPDEALVDEERQMMRRALAGKGDEFDLGSASPQPSSNNGDAEAETTDPTTLENNDLDQHNSQPEAQDHVHFTSTTDPEHDAYSLTKFPTRSTMSMTSTNPELHLTATGSPVSQSLWTEQEEYRRGIGEELDCAITTSSEGSSASEVEGSVVEDAELGVEGPALGQGQEGAKGDERNEKAREAKKATGRSAWVELWEGLSSFAGVRED